MSWPGAVGTRNFAEVDAIEQRSHSIYSHNAGGRFESFERALETLPCATVPARAPCDHNTFCGPFGVECLRVTAQVTGRGHDTIGKLDAYVWGIDGRLSVELREHVLLCLDIWELWRWLVANSSLTRHHRLPFNRAYATAQIPINVTVSLATGRRAGCHSGVSNSRWESCDAGVGFLWVQQKRALQKHAMPEVARLVRPCRHTETLANVSP
jgi:hypothetical protein